MSKVWISRDDDERGEICGWKDSVMQPGLSKSDKGIWSPNTTNYIEHVINIIENVDAKSFKKDFGFTPRKGTCKQYNLSLKEIT